MGTRCSGRPSSDRVGGATGAAALAGAAPACRASPLVTRPPRPEPSTDAGSTPFSAKILLAAGDATAAEAVAAGAAAAGAASAAAAGAAAAVALPSESMRARTSPAVTVLPSPLTISFRTPEAGAGTSRTTLLVLT